MFGARTVPWFRSALLQIAAALLFAGPAGAIEVCEEVFEPPDFVRRVCREITDCSDAFTFRERQACEQLCRDPALRSDPMCRDYREPECEPDERLRGGRCEPLRCRPDERPFEGKCLRKDPMSPPPPPLGPVPPILASPTGLGLRGCDNHGCGNFNARRRDKKRVYSHEGVDILATIGQTVVAPVGARVVRAVERISPNEPRFQGVLLETSSGFRIKILYVQPNRELIGTRLDPGQVLGIAQDVTVKAPAADGKPAIPNHIHLEVRSPSGELRDPTKLLRGLPR
jgi:hypothetical protein